ncbi:MAG: hypothetical protein QOG85_1059 [Gaiellaceae bacterium]|jgi:uncharacterized cupin superfamily protein|nr:hypothetical protein [Gaiellaceae bacterium]
MEIVNLLSIPVGGAMEHEGFRVRGVGVGRRIGAELLGGGLYEIDPGKKLWPYHVHHANEEWVVVVRGRPTLRTPDGDRELVEGDVACFPRGAAGAHQLRNATDETVRVLMLSTMLSPEFIEYPDSGKVLAKDAKDDDIFMGRLGEPAEYWDGES